jgi:glyoxylase-like metal-dependent hydrolase (beta-lactamase superfamily II)
MLKPKLNSTHPLLFLCLLVLCSTWLLMTASAQAQESATEKSYQQARRTLAAGIEALGGLDAIATIQRVSLIERGKAFDVFQSPTPILGPAQAKDGADTLQRLFVDFGSARLLHERGSNSPRYAWRFLTLINADKGYRIDPWSRTAAPMKTPSLNDFRAQFQKLPQFLLREVLTERAASLRSLGESEIEGRRYAAITFIDRDNRQVTLYFDTQTKLLARSEYLITDAAVGDTKTESVYQGYRRLEKWQVPTGLVTRTGQHSVSEVSYEIQLDPPLPESLFALPAGLQLVTPVTIPANRLTAIAKDVYLLENAENTSYNVLVVAFDEFLLVAEAPENRPHAGLSERIIAMIKAKLPGKPIRYLTFSHHHLDHGCGVRAYIAEGATILTTPGNQNFIETLAAAPFILKPDALARAPRLPKLEIIANKKHVIRDAHHVVELYDIGPYWHAREEVLVYLPQEKLLFEGDLFTSGSGEDVVPAYDHPIFLADRLKELGLDVQHIAGVHGRLRPVTDLYKAIEKRNRMERK